jgi:hypothetical protein
MIVGIQDSKIRSQVNSTMKRAKIPRSVLALLQSALFSKLCPWL